MLEAPGAQLAEGGDERVLAGVLGDVDVIAHRHRQAEDQVLEARHQLIEGRAVALAAGRHQLDEVSHGQTGEFHRGERGGWSGTARAPGIRWRQG